MEYTAGHKVAKSFKSGQLWTLVCECGRRWHSYRWLCEEQHLDHQPIEETEPKMPLWWDDASYIRYQSMP